MSSPTNNEQPLEMENVSSARRKDISIGIVKQGRHTLLPNERTAWDIDRLINPDPNRKGPVVNQAKGKGKTPTPWYIT